jgi:transcriptional regulator with AAA-type ATPase domain
MTLDKTREERLQRLVELCAVDRTPESLDDIYVEPVESAASRILRRSRALPMSVDHTLLMGGRGCGKSTELRRLHQRLSQTERSSRFCWIWITPGSTQRT